MPGTPTDGVLWAPGPSQGEMPGNHDQKGRNPVASRDQAHKPQGGTRVGCRKVPDSPFLANTCQIPLVPRVLGTGGTEIGTARGQSTAWKEGPWAGNQKRGWWGPSHLWLILLSPNFRRMSLICLPHRNTMSISQFPGLGWPQGTSESWQWI